MFNIRVTWFYMPLMTDTPIDEFYWSLSIYYLDFNMFDSKFWTMRSWAEKKRKIMPVLKYRHESEPVDLVLIVVFHDATQDFMPPWSWATQHSHGHATWWFANRFMENNIFSRDILENLLAKTNINIKFKIGLNPLQISKTIVSKNLWHCLLI